MRHRSRLGLWIAGDRTGLASIRPERGFWTIPHLKHCRSGKIRSVSFVVSDAIMKTTLDIVVYYRV